YTYGGLRPLVEEQTTETYSQSRRYEIYDNATDGVDGLFTVEGGKYTTSRNLAEKTVDMVCEKLSRKDRLGSSTNQRYLYGSDIRDMVGFISQIKAANKDFSPETVDYLGRHYGNEYDKILGLARADKSLAEVVTHDGEILAEVVFACREEMAETLQDIVLRRSGIATLGNPGEEVLRKVAAVAARELGWDEARTEKEIKDTVERLRVPTT
ncbi:MAG: glycerol-3-phosphate dehydrogenase C-terminal domain-containing protein, partial [Smithellaceae bacterium]|nr:glycerol-3-phosphate dehydrogenase C-terminal domain-containing protein [Smithellaceae bacterium]